MKADVGMQAGKDDRKACPTKQPLGQVEAPRVVWRGLALC